MLPQGFAGWGLWSLGGDCACACSFALIVCLYVMAEVNMVERQ